MLNYKLCGTIWNFKVPLVVDLLLKESSNGLLKNLFPTITAKLKQYSLLFIQRGITPHNSKVLKLFMFQMLGTAETFVFKNNSFGISPISVGHFTYKSKGRSTFYFLGPFLRGFILVKENIFFIFFNYIYF